MEPREILIANTRTQKRSKITTSATTLGELKADLDNAGIDYSGMTFTEGISKTQLLDDATQLPQNVIFKGQPTNNLVILLTNTKKNIASGTEGSRTDAKALITTTTGLPEEIKRITGKNWTIVPTTTLWDIINKFCPSTPDLDKEEDEDWDKYAKPAPVFSGSSAEFPPAEDGDEDEETDENPINYTVKQCLLFQITAMKNHNLLSNSDLNDIILNLQSLIDADSVNSSASAESKVFSDSSAEGIGDITSDDIDDMIDDLL